MAFTLRAEKVEWLLLAVPRLIWGASFLFTAQLEARGWAVWTHLCSGFDWLPDTFSSSDGPKTHLTFRLEGHCLFWRALAAFPLTTFPFAERHVASALTGMLNGANPLFTAMVASVVARRSPSPRYRRYPSAAFKRTTNLHKSEPP